MEEEIKNKVREIQSKYCGASVETKLYHAIEETLDDNNILHGNDAERFVKNMIKAETEPPTKKEIELIEEIKRDGEAGLFDVTPTKPDTSQEKK